MGPTLPRCISQFTCSPCQSQRQSGQLTGYSTTQIPGSHFTCSLCLRSEVSNTEWTADRIQHYQDTRESPANSLCLRRVNPQSVLSEWTLKVSFQSDLSKGPFRVNSQSVLSEWTLKVSFQSEPSKCPFQSELSKCPFRVNSQCPFRVNPQSVLSEWPLKSSFQGELSKCPFRVNPQSVLSEWTLKVSFTLPGSCTKHRLQAPSSKLCQYWLCHWRGTLYQTNLS